MRWNLLIGFSSCILLVVQIVNLQREALLTNSDGSIADSSEARGIPLQDDFVDTQEQYFRTSNTSNHRTICFKIAVNEKFPEISLDAYHNSFKLIVRNYTVRNWWLRIPQHQALAVCISYEVGMQFFFMFLSFLPI
ncbi:MAG: hypothetical protein EZS28_023264, partial [Streblomastix strix]